MDAILGISHRVLFDYGVTEGGGDFAMKNCVTLHFGHQTVESSWMLLVPSPQNIKVFTQPHGISSQTHESSATQP